MRKQTYGKILAKRIAWFLETNYLLPNSQAGFREGRSTIDQIMTLEAKIKEGFNKKLNTYAIFLDLCNVYDSTWHEAILFKMARLEVKGKTLKWIKNFLKNRTMKVRIDVEISETTSQKVSVPQGSVLSPLLCLIMISDFPESSRLCGNLEFADDFVTYCRASNNCSARLIMQPHVRRHQALPLHIQQLYRRRWRRCHPALRLRIQQLCNHRWLQYHQALRLHIQQLFSRRLIIHHQARPERRRKWQEDGRGNKTNGAKKWKFGCFEKILPTFN